MIAQIFGEIPVECPRCGTIMDLKEFAFDKTIIVKFFPFASIAPPKLALEAHREKTFEDYVPDDSGIRYIRDEEVITDSDNQLGPETEADFNQEINW